jgi:hypothetical protein
VNKLLNSSYFRVKEAHQIREVRQKEINGALFVRFPRRQQIAYCVPHSRTTGPHITSLSQAEWNEKGKKRAVMNEKKTALPISQQAKN